MTFFRILLLAFLMVYEGAAMAQEPADKVNPFIGTTNFGTTNPGAVLPNGMMSVVPFNVMGSSLNKYDKDACWWSTPYEFYNKFFTGFAHGSLSGVGCPESGSLLTMPTTGDMELDYHNYGSEYTEETASPGYYALTLKKYGIRTEATATMRTSLERYTFPKGQGHVILNLGEGLTNENGAYLKRVGDKELEGMKLLGTFCYNAQAVFPIYFVLRVDKTPSRSGFWKKQLPKQGVEGQWDVFAGKYKFYERYQRDMAGDDLGYCFTFDDLKDGEQVQVSVGISYVSCENARQNLEAEQPQGITFEEIHSSARQRWNEDLGRIRIKGGTEEQQEVFYTALYHTLIHPSVLNDVNGEYPLMESGGVGTTDGVRYTIFSLWDTYRNLHQLMTLVYPERQRDMLRSMVDMYREWGWLPKWELFGRETFTMEGDPSIPVIVDSYLKGLTDFDVETAYEAMRKSALTEGKNNRMRPDIDPYATMGYIPLGAYAKDLSGDNSVSHALEYYVADYALSLLAEKLGKKEDATLFRERSLGYRHYYCKDFGTLRPITAEGKFLTPFNPRQGENFEPVPGFHEGSAWNYTFYVPHDILGLAKLMGGKRKFTDKLQRVFDEGLYDPANEPDIAYPYLFSRFRGEEWRTQQTVDTLLKKYFTAKADGIPGNDDAGTMSAWAVFSMMGLYPDCPGEPYYTLTTPTFERVEIDTERGTLEITTQGEKDARFIRKMTLDGKPWHNYRISHENLMSKKKLHFLLEGKHP